MEIDFQNDKTVSKDGNPFPDLENSFQNWKSISKPGNRDANFRNETAPATLDRQTNKQRQTNCSATGSCSALPRRLKISQTSENCEKHQRLTNWAEDRNCQSILTTAPAGTQPQRAPRGSTHAAARSRSCNTWANMHFFARCACHRRDAFLEKTHIKKVVELSAWRRWRHRRSSCRQTHKLPLIMRFLWSIFVTDEKNFLKNKYEKGSAAFCAAPLAPPLQQMPQKFTFCH